jgi:hypothetical protein
MNKKDIENVAELGRISYIVSEALEKATAESHDRNINLPLFLKYALDNLVGSQNGENSEKKVVPEPLADFIEIIKPSLEVYIQKNIQKKYNNRSAEASAQEVIKKFSGVISPLIIMLKAHAALKEAYKVYNEKTLDQKNIEPTLFATEYMMQFLPMLNEDEINYLTRKNSTLIMISKVLSAASGLNSMAEWASGSQVDPTLEEMVNENQVVLEPDEDPY